MSWETKREIAEAPVQPGPGAPADRPRRAARLLAGLATVGCAAAAVLTYAFYRQQLTWVREEHGRTLTNIAEIKANAIAAWRRERAADGAGVPLNPAFAGFVRRFLAGRAGPEAEQEIRRYFQLLRTNHDYGAVRLYDPTGTLRLSDPPSGGPPVSAAASTMAIEALRQHRVIFEDFHLSEGGVAHLAVVGPICDGGGRCSGVIRLLIDPAQYLYPQLQAWPTPSRTGETLLVRREGEEVVFLNELRHRKATAVRLRLPASQPDLPAAKVVSGYEGVFEGNDYRGEPVLAAVRRIPDTPWALVTKIDRLEAYEGLRIRTVYFAAVSLLVVIAVSCGVLLAWSRRDSEHYRQMADQRRRAEQDLIRLNSELEQRVRERTAELEAANKELEAFAYSVSHDLRAPLRGIDGWTMALIEDYCSVCPRMDEHGKKYLDRVRGEAQRMGSLIDDLLQLSRVTRAQMHRDSVDISAIAHTVAARLQETHADRRIDVRIEPGLTAVGDERLIEIALTNLLGNAVKFTATRDLSTIEVGRAHNGGSPAFYVRDNGVGFDMSYAESLFGAFQRLHKASEFPGSGIGLATVQRIVRRHGGRIWGEAEPDRGATFYFVLEEKE